MIVLEECLGATGACAKDFQPAYKGFPTCLQFIYYFIKKTFGEYPGIIETEDTFGSDLTELEFHPSLLHRIWCCLRPLVLRTYLRSCPIMLHRHHFFSYRQLRLVKWKREAKPLLMVDMFPSMWDLAVLAAHSSAQSLSSSLLSSSGILTPKYAICFYLLSSIPTTFANLQLQIQIFKIWKSLEKFVWCSFRQCAQQVSAYASAEPYVSPA